MSHVPVPSCDPACDHCGVRVRRSDDYGVMTLRAFNPNLGWFNSSERIFSHDGICWSETEDRYRDRVKFSSPPQSVYPRF